MSDKSAYELEREETMAKNRKHLQSLGLEPLEPTPSVPKKKRLRTAKEPEATRTSARTRSLAPDNSGALIDSMGDDEPALRRKLRRTPAASPTSAAAAGSSSSAAAGSLTPPPAAPLNPWESRAPRAANAFIVERVRAYVEEHVPQDAPLEERSMFGHAMWLVKGNMFMGVGLKSSRLLVRVGESRVEATLAAHPEGVARCGTPGGRTFPGTIMVEPEQFKGDERLAVWFGLAMAHNDSMEPKEAAAKPRAKQKKPPPPPPPQLAKEADEEVMEVEEAEAAGEAEEAEEQGEARPRAASTSSGAFARGVLKVICRIPRGKVASYGQVAALAGAPRNARQVGALLRDGLCTGGAPWYRVLGASGKISLPSSTDGRYSGDVQRRRLEAEGVAFRGSGAVAPGAFWSRTEPFFA